MNFETIDIILIIPLIYFAIIGFNKGFIIQIATLSGLIFGILAAYYFSDSIIPIIGKHIQADTTMLSLISFTLIFIITLTGIYILGKCIERIIKIASLSILNKLAGAILSILKGAIIISYTLLLINTFDINHKIIKETTKSNSILYPHLEPINKHVTSIYNKMKGKTTELFNNINNNN